MSTDEHLWRLKKVKDILAGERVRFPDPYGEQEVAEVIRPATKLHIKDSGIVATDIAFTIGAGKDRQTVVLDGDEQLQVFGPDPVDTVLREGRKFSNDVLDLLGIPRPTGLDFGPPLDSKGKVLRQYVPMMEMGGMLGLTALAWGVLRAIYECPDCPGHYRVPMEQRDDCWRQVPFERAGDDSTWEAIACPHCQGLWTRIQEPGKVEQLALF